MPRSVIVAEFHAPPDTLPSFRTLFQQGVGVSIQAGVTLEDLLCRQWQIDRDYVMNRISTLFLDGKPVDDLAASVVADGATLALSGAMPGLIGATMRRGGVLAPFRSGITYCASAAPHTAGDGRITLKLFNLLIDELGPRFLARGVWIERARLAEHFPGHPDLAGTDNGKVCVFMPPHRPTSGCP
jgi:hypothetical protein